MAKDLKTPIRKPDVDRLSKLVENIMRGESPRTPPPKHPMEAGATPKHQNQRLTKVK